MVLMVYSSYSQNLPDLPIPTGAGTAEVWNDSIYFFGGASRWSGTVRYPHVYKFDGSSWNYHDSIPDNSLWDVISVLVGDDVYLLSGWPSAARSIRKYSLIDRSWTYLSLSPNVSSWGTTAEYLNGYIYLFNSNGNVFEYDITNDIWTTKTSNDTVAYLGLASAVYQDEIYLVGFYGKRFYKYTPGTDQWTQLAEMPYRVASGALEFFDGHLYSVGGSEQGTPQDMQQTVVGYIPVANYWFVDSFQISSPRIHLASVLHRNMFYVLGGFDTTVAGVSLVEEVVPDGPFPFQLVGFTGQMINGSSIQLDWRTLIEINNLGFEVEFARGTPDSFMMVVNGFVPGQGTTTVPHDYTFIDSSVSAGVWFYRLKQIGLNGTVHYTEPIMVDVVTVVPPLGIAFVFALEQNYPNPFNPVTNIRFSLSESAHVSLKVYDLLGREVATLVDEMRVPGLYDERFDARSLASGTYLYRLTTPFHSAARKLVLVK